jgi:hypothetical protein
MCTVGHPLPRLDEFQKSYAGYLTAPELQAIDSNLHPSKYHPNTIKNKVTNYMYIKYTVDILCKYQYYIYISIHISISPAISLPILPPRHSWAISVTPTARR